MTPQIVTDAPLAHLRWGDGTTAVWLLHGVGGGSAAWSDPLCGTGSALATAGYLAIAVDFPGYGASPTIAPYTLAGVAQSLAALIESTGARQNALVGHSMGGMVAQELMVHASRNVHALVLCNTSPAFGKPGGDWQQQFLRDRFAPLDAGRGMAALAAALVPTMLAPGTRPEVLAAAQALMAGVPEATYRSALAAIVGFERRNALARIGVPTLVLTGEHDTTAPPGVTQRMASRIPNAESALLEGCGHLANIEAPLRFNRTLLGFLQRHLRA
jgi:pimeloyl-ACP methyl ester carboxylesterase